ncbi:MAG: M48 family metalloprotease [Pseudomonadota bacterium]|nr:M48 family metalloprotease [Pseudomonadota bacterium]
MNKFIYIILFVLALPGLLFPGREVEAKKFTLIRDAETESVLLSFAKPLFQVANQTTDSIKIYIVKNASLNAFVAGGSNIFVHTGLITSSESVAQLIGVLAHEVGHIEGGHLSRLARAQKKTSTYILLGTLMGGAAALLGNPSAATALVSGGYHIGNRELLSFSRSHELAADRAALRYLDKLNLSANGLYKFLKLLSHQELLSVKQQDPYVRTHPPNKQRMDVISSHLARSKYSNSRPPKHMSKSYDRIKAKLAAFLNPTKITLKRYPDSNKSIGARYARAIAYYRQPNFEKANKLIQNLINEFPKDPYFLELSGQIFFENGYSEKAQLYYGKALKLRPDSSLIRADLAVVQLESGKKPAILEAIKNFEISLMEQPKRPLIWRQLGIAYGKINKMGESAAALAEEALLLGAYKDAMRLAKRAKENLTIDSPKWIRADDINRFAKHKLGKSK